MNTRALLPLLPLLSGCVIISSNDDNADDETSSGDGDGDPTTTGDGDGDPTTTGDGDGDPTTGDGDGDGDGDMWCGLEDTGPGDPYFSLSQFGEPLQDGGDLAVECGFQGFFMIEIDPTIGGFIPDSQNVDFHLTLDVEGFNVGPDGHFAAGDFGIFVDCCTDDYYDYCYYNTTTFQMFPPDTIEDLSVIHGAAGHLEITMDTPQGEVMKALDVTMWAMEQDMEWQYCSYY